MDVHTGRDWVIRHNLFRRIRGPQGELAGPAVLVWNASSGTTVEGNTFIDCHREISLGLIERTPNDHTGGLVRNNFIARGPGSGGDVAIAVFDSPSTRVVHNTIWLNGQYDNAIEVRFPHSTGVVVTNNLSDRPLQNRDGGSSSAQGNLWSAASNWFVSAISGNLHLTASATAAIDHGVATGDAPTDWDGQTRPSGSGVDVGADESSGGTPPPTDTTAPSVSVTAPTAGATVGGTTSFTVTATDDVGVAGVRFLVNGVAVGQEDTTAPYQLSLNTTTISNGTVGLQATARDAAGNTRTSATVFVTVNNVIADTTRPTVSLTTPSNGASVSGTVAVAATAADNVGVTSVQFTLNGVNLGAPDVSAPWAVNWNTTGAANGSHVLRAIASDAAGNQRTSAARTVVVNNQSSDTTPPTVNLSSPVAGATIAGVLTMAASATDDVGVVSVRFLVNGVVVGEDTTAPYQTAWNTATASDGTHGAQVVARDAAGNVRYAQAVFVTIRNHPVDDTPPVVSLATPAAGATVSGPTTISAVASDNVGITSVQFTLDGANLGNAITAAPYVLNWDTTSSADGSHTLRAVARDAAGNSTTSVARTVTTANTSQPTPSVRDLNGDHRPDLLFQHSSGQLQTWFMTGTTRAGSQVLTPTAMYPGWRSVAVDDFNADGWGDVLFQHESTGQIALWIMQGTHRVLETGIWNGGPSVWRVAATGDVNGDGHTDIVWQHPATGAIKVWLMYYWSLRVEAGVAPYQADPNWRLAATGDINRNGRADLIWQHQTSGALTVWYLAGDGRTTTGTQSLAVAPVTAGWRLVVADDFDRNGSPDLVWHHPGTGQLAIWLMNGVQFTGEQPLSPAVVDTSWVPTGGR